MKLSEYEAMLDVVFKSNSTYKQKITLVESIVECFASDSFAGCDIDEARRVKRLIQDDLAAYYVAEGVNK